MGPNRKDTFQVEGEKLKRLGSKERATDFIRTANKVGELTKKTTKKWTDWIQENMD